MRTGVCTPACGRSYAKPNPAARAALRASLRGRRDGRGANSIEPLLRSLQLLIAGKCVRACPHTVQRLNPAVCGHGVAERLPKLVLAELQLHAQQPRNHLAQSAAPCASRLEALSE